MATRATIAATEGKILKALVGEELKADELAVRISTSTDEVRKAVFYLLEKGRVTLTRDWKLKRLPD